MVVGIILAAGLSVRMGNFKQLLPLEGHTVVEHVVGQVEQCLKEIIVVLGHRAEEVADVLKNTPVRCIFNRDYAVGMTSSVQCAIASAPHAGGYLICLGDQPGISGDIVDQVVAAVQAEGKGIVIPTYKEKRGHPVYINRSYAEEILALPEDKGLNTVTRGHPEDTLELPITSREILDDMDTPADYQRELERQAAIRGKLNG